MNRTVILAGIMISLIVFWLIGFVNTLHDDVDVIHRLDEKSVEKSYTTVDIYANDTLTLEEKKALWSSSDLKVEILQLFPHFMEMKSLVEEDIEGDSTFKDELLAKIENVEFEYIGGGLSGKKAKEALANF